MVNTTRVNVRWQSGVWYLYEVGESQNIGIVKEGNEDEVIRHLYYKIRGRVGGTI